MRAIFTALIAAVYFCAQCMIYALPVMLGIWLWNSIFDFVRSF